MPAISSGKVLVTGANGYIAVWIIKLLLEAGFAVKGTVRSEDKATHLRQLFKPFGDRFETAIVPDITKEDAFVPHVADIDAIAHAASPVNSNVDDPAEVIGPAVAGTLAVLAAAHAHAPRLQRVVVLSSTAALAQPTTEPRVLDESAWNERSVAEVRERGRAAEGMHKYRASKTLAERAAWEWYAARRAEGALRWDLTVLNPPYVFGPLLHDVGGTPGNLNESVREYYETVVTRAKRDDAALANDGVPWVHVRDIAQAHVLALQKPDAGGERFIISADICKWQELVTVAHRLSDKISAGNTAYDPSKAMYMIRYDNTKSVRVLGIKYHTVEELTRDTLEDFKVRGWL